MKVSFYILALGLLTAAIPGIPTAFAEGPPAASRAFTSTDPVVVKARAVFDAGSFSDAEKMLRESITADDMEADHARSELLEIIRRTRFEYSLTPEQLLKKVQKSVPDATAEDVDRWAKIANIRFRMIDGQKFYYRYEPENIFIFCPEAKKRRAKAGHTPDRGDWKQVDYLQSVVDEAHLTGKTELMPVKHTVTHTLTINPTAPGVKAGALVRVWLPFPQEYGRQRGVKLLSASPEPKLIAPNAIDGNPVTGAPQRTVYFEQKIIDPSQPLKFTEVFEYTMSAYYPHLDPKQVQPLPADWNGAYLDERPPHIVFTGDIRAEVAKIIGHETNALLNARKIFRWVSKNIPWNAEDEYCIIPSFTKKGFATRRGDCGVQNTVFVTMCRIAGIPARWQSGYETKPLKEWGMHDWSEIYIAPWGWLPTDASYGIQKSRDPEVAEFFCGHQDSYRMIINLDWGRELVPPKGSFRSEPADFQRGEVEVNGQNLYYDQWKTETTIVRDPGPNPPRNPKE